VFQFQFAVLASTFAQHIALTIIKLRRQIEIAPRSKLFLIRSLIFKSFGFGK